jgi:non-ribosomal peptide synthetase component F
VREFGGLQVGPLGVSSTSRFDLVLFINDPEGAPVTTWMYNPNLFEASTIERMAALYEAVLAQVASNPGVLVQRLYEELGSVEAKLRGAEEREFQAASRQKLKNIKRRAVSESST